MTNIEKEPPQFVFVLGSICSGKTHFIRENFKSGFVHLDAGDIFIQLSQEKYFDFPSVFENEMNTIGFQIAVKALSEKLNIVVELLGDNLEELSKISEMLKALGYEVHGHFIECDVEIAVERNKNRSADNISAFYTQAYHLKWLTEAIAWINSEKKQ